MLIKALDPYERKARLYPVFIALIPVIAIVFCLYGIERKFDAALMSLLASLGIFYLLSSVGREFGKRLEGELFKKWGGIPTTQLLRHRDSKIDSFSKARYHTFLSEHLKINMPSIADEEADPTAADHIYSGCISWLKEKTRDKKKFKMLSDENVTYGFRRNALGLKPLALVILIFSFFWILFSAHILSLSGGSYLALLNIDRAPLSALLITLVMFLVWVFFFTQKSVHTAAFTYAQQLIRACEVLPKKRS
ncbi:hypothetical protein DZB54_20465 [Herbaspirillum sp. 3R-3a1]|nr:hypothetical protein DZB54_20465 [Herbaspirillum sp. 3R-3a1]